MPELPFGAAVLVVPEGDPEEIRACAQVLIGTSGQLAGVASELGSMPGMLSSWQGRASVSYAGSALTNGKALSAGDVALARAGQVLRSYADELEDAQRKVRRAIEHVDEAQRAIEAAETALGEAAGERTDASTRAGAAELEITLTGLAGAPSAGAMDERRRAQADEQAAADREAGARRKIEAAREDRRAAEKQGLAGERAAEDAARVAAGALRSLSYSPAAAYAGQLQAARARRQAARERAEAEKPSTGEKILDAFGGGPAWADPLAGVQEQNLELLDDGLAYLEDLPAGGLDPLGYGLGAEDSKDLRNEALGISELRRAIKASQEGDDAGAALHGALAWPGTKALKALKELGEQGVRRVTKRGGEEAAEVGQRSADDLLAGWADKAGSRSHASRELAKSLENAPAHGPRPPGHEPHHLVPSHDPRAAEAQKILQRLEVHPNQAENGAWMPGPKAKGADPPPVGTPHRPIHTSDYYERITTDLRRADSKEEALSILEDIGQRARRGDYP